jgi:hypothetical protein
MAFKVGTKTYAHANARAKITPKEGPNAGQGIEVKSAKSISGNTNAESALLMGTSNAPLAIVPAGSKPEVELGLDALEESGDIAKHLGPGACFVLCDLSVVFSMPGKPAREYLAENVMFTKGFGLKSESGSAPNDTIGGNCTDIKIDGVSVLTLPEESE